jgi:thioredoxin reductase
MENAEAVYRFFEVVIVGGGIAGLSAADTLI